MFDYHETSVQLNAIERRGLMKVKVDGICGALTVGSGSFCVCPRNNVGCETRTSLVRPPRRRLSLFDYFSSTD